jgi:hypothetical protein
MALSRWANPSTQASLNVLPKAKTSNTPSPYASGRADGGDQDGLGTALRYLAGIEATGKSLIPAGTA